MFLGLANAAQTRQTRPDSGLDFQAKVLKTFKSFPFRSEAERTYLLLVLAAMLD